MRPIQDDIRAAAHEAGHALVAWFSETPAVIVSVSIEPTLGGRAGGHTIWATPNHRAGIKQCWEEIAICMGGLAGEGVGTGTIRSVGGTLDLKTARMIAESCIRDARVPWQVHRGSSQVDVGMMFSPPLRGRTRHILNIGYLRARTQIMARRRPFNELVRTLLLHRTIGANRLEHILGTRF